MQTIIHNNALISPNGWTICPRKHTHTPSHTHTHTHTHTRTQCFYVPYTNACSLHTYNCTVLNFARTVCENNVWIYPLMLFLLVHSFKLCTIQFENIQGLACFCRYNYHINDCISVCLRAKCRIICL